MTDDDSCTYSFKLILDGRTSTISSPNDYVRVKELKSIIRRHLNIWYKFQLTHKETILGNDEEIINLRSHTPDTACGRPNHLEPLSNRPHTELPVFYLNRIKSHTTVTDTAKNTHSDIHSRNNSKENRQQTKTPTNSRRVHNKSIISDSINNFTDLNTLNDGYDQTNSEDDYSRDHDKYSRQLVPSSEVEDPVAIENNSCDKRSFASNSNKGGLQIKSNYNGFSTQINLRNSPIQIESDDNDININSYNTKSSTDIFRQVASVPLPSIDDLFKKSKSRSISKKSQQHPSSSSHDYLLNTSNKFSNLVHPPYPQPLSGSDNDDDIWENECGNSFTDELKINLSLLNSDEEMTENDEYMQSKSMKQALSSTNAIRPGVKLQTTPRSCLTQSARSKRFGQTLLKRSVTFAEPDTDELDKKRASSITNSSSHRRKTINNTNTNDLQTTRRIVREKQVTYSKVESARTPNPQKRIIDLQENSMNEFHTNTVTVKVETLNNVYRIKLSINAPLKELRQRIWNVLENENCCQDAYALLLFTRRMHIFEETNTDDELMITFLRLKSTNDETNNEQTIHFYAYTLKHKFYNSMYAYETDPKSLFVNSKWWESQICPPQQSIAQTMMLSTLYVLHQYFRRPVQEEIGQRNALEAQFLLEMRKYLFRPALLALKHLLNGEMFAYEKKILIDGLLTLLMPFCPSKIGENLVGTFMPYLICWIFHQCNLESTEGDPCVEINLLRPKDGIENHYLNDPTTETEINPDYIILYEREEIKKHRCIRHVDIFSLIKHLKGPNLYHSGYPCKIESYFIDLSKTNEIDSIERMTDAQIVNLCNVMQHRYQCFTLITRETLHNFLRDQLIMLNDRNVGIAFERRQRVYDKNMIDYDIHVFEPTMQTEAIIRHTQHIYEIDPSRPDPQLPSYTLQMMPNKDIAVMTNTRPIEQLTMVLLDTSGSMFRSHVENNPNLPTFFDLSRAIVFLLSNNLQWHTHPHAIGLILFGSRVNVQCNLTQDPDEFEREINKIPTFENGWTHVYDAIVLALNVMENYKSQQLIAGDCNQLIICISDGVDYKSKTTLEQVKHKVKQAHTRTVIDLVSFVTDTRQLENNEERQKFQKFCDLCEKTDGNIYRIKLFEPADLTQIFEQETAWWLKARKQRTIMQRNARANRVDFPKRSFPDRLYETANRLQAEYKTNTKQRIQSTGSPLARIRDEARTIAISQMNGIHLFIHETDITFWKIILEGPRNTLYANGRWLLYISFPEQYPNIPPDVRFYTPIFHVNINMDGQICHELLRTAWSTRVRMQQVLEAVMDLLAEPNYSDPISIQRAALYHQNKQEYELRVHEWKNKYAKKSIENLCNEFKLE